MHSGCMPHTPIELRVATVCTNAVSFLLWRQGLTYVSLFWINYLSVEGFLRWRRFAFKRHFKTGQEQLLRSQPVFFFPSPTNTFVLAWTLPENTDQVHREQGAQNSQRSRSLASHIRLVSQNSWSWSSNSHDKEVTQVASWWLRDCSVGKALIGQVWGLEFISPELL